MISDLLKHKASAAESEARLQHFTKFVKHQKRTSKLTKHQQHWTAQSKKLQRERKEAERDLAAAIALLPTSDIQDCLDDEVEWSADRKQFGNALLSSALGFKLKVSNGRYTTEELKKDLKSLKEYLKESEVIAEDNEMRLSTELTPMASCSQSDIIEEDAGPKGFENLIDQRVESIVSNLEGRGIEVDEGLLGLFEEGMLAQNADYLERARTLHEQRDAADADINYVGKSLERLVALVREYSTGDQAILPAELHDRLTFEFPDEPPQRLRKATWGIQRQRWVDSRLKALKKEFRNTLEGLLINCEQGLEVASSLEEARERRQAEAVRREEERHVLQQKIIGIKELKAEKQRLALEAQLAKEAEEERIAAAAQEKREVYMKEQLQALHEHHEKRQEEQQKLQAIQREKDALDMERQAQQMEVNAKRVAYREGEYNKKMDALERRKDDIAREHAEREERLEALVAKVKVVATRDPMRILQETECTKVKEDAEVANVQLFGVHGYTTAEMMKDQRFRLQEALGKAGLLHTDYAKSALATAAPAHAPRVDMYVAAPVMGSGMPS